MYLAKALALPIVIASVIAERPSNTSICDYYTTALLKENNSTNQYTLLTLLVNTAVIGNYTKPNVGVKVTGILNPGTYNDTDVNLLPYFDGGLASSNNGTSTGASINFLDDGGAAPLMMNLPANGVNSNQYFLLSHLYQFFGYLLGCSTYGQGTFPAYSGDASMAGVHEFMDLDPFQTGYFIFQVGLAASSFGVSDSDVAAVAKSLNALFNYRCSAAVTVIPDAGPQLQAICQDPTCPLAPNATCSGYIAEVTPLVANGTLAMGEGTNVTNATATTGSNSAGGSRTGPSPTATMGAHGASDAGRRLEGLGFVVGALTVGFAVLQGL